MVCLRNISVDTLHKGVTDDDDGDDDNNNNKPKRHNKLQPKISSISLSPALKRRR